MGNLVGAYKSLASERQSRVNPVFLLAAIVIIHLLFGSKFPIVSLEDEARVQPIIQTSHDASTGQASDEYFQCH